MKAKILLYWGDFLGAGFLWKAQNIAGARNQGKCRYNA